ACSALSSFCSWFRSDGRRHWRWRWRAVPSAVPAAPGVGVRRSQSGTSPRWSRPWSYVCSPSPPPRRSAPGIRSSPPEPAGSGGRGWVGGSTRPDETFEVRAPFLACCGAGQPGGGADEQGAVGRLRLGGGFELRPVLKVCTPEGALLGPRSTRPVRRVHDPARAEALRWTVVDEFGETGDHLIPVTGEGA